MRWDEMSNWGFKILFDGLIVLKERIDIVLSITISFENDTELNQMRNGLGMI